MSRRLTVTFLLDDIAEDQVAIGRDAWALMQLLKAGDGGLTTLQNPAPRWSHYIWKLRAQGVNIETIDEAHGGLFSGSHARYILRSLVRVVDLNQDASVAA